MRLGHHHVKRDGFLVGVLGFGFREEGDAGLERSTHRLSATCAQPFADPTNFERLHGFRSRGEVVERQVTQFFGLVETAGGLGDACVLHAGRGEVVRRRRVTLRHGEARCCFVVRVHARGALGREHRISERFVVVAGRVVVPRNVGDRGGRSQLERTRNAMMKVRARPIGNGASRGVGEDGVSEVELATFVPLRADDDGRRHAFVERAFDVRGFARPGRDQQVGVERTSKESRVRDHGRSAW